MPRNLLIEYLPDEGFQWSANSGTALITNHQARQVTRAMKRSGRRLDESVCTEYIAHLFNTAKNMVHRCQAFDAPSFWEFVSRRVSWAQRVDPKDLYDLSIRIISARRIFLDQRDYLAEMKKEGDEDIPDSDLIRVFNEANTAVDSFTSAVADMYKDRAKIREKYYPKWTDDSDNEGTSEATKARFHEKCKAPRNLSSNNSAKDQENGLEGEYEKIVEMVEKVEIVDRMDEDMDGEMDEVEKMDVDSEMDYEMEMDN